MQLENSLLRNLLEHPVQVSAKVTYSSMRYMLPLKASDFCPTLYVELQESSIDLGVGSGRSC
jgi:hypothetical protein